MIRREFSLMWAVCFVFLMVEITSQAKGQGEGITQTPGGYGPTFKRRNEILSDEARTQGGLSRPNPNLEPSQLQRGKSSSHPERPDKGRLNRPDKKPGDEGPTFDEKPNNRPGKRPKGRNSSQ
ncbi:uncharacterized protein LOC144646985 [Oculina patagonica]